MASRGRDNDQCSPPDDKVSRPDGAFVRAAPASVLIVDTGDGEQI